MMILIPTDIVTDASGAASIDYALIAGFISIVLVAATGEIGAMLVAFFDAVLKGFL